MADDDHQADICRVCRCEGCSERPLFYPCICTGSIKYIHQECLVQWMRYSRKEYCELCGYRFSFTPIYSPDMPRRLPMRDVAAGLLSSVATAVKYVLKTKNIVLLSYVISLFYFQFALHFSDTGVTTQSLHWHGWE